MVRSKWKGPFLKNDSFFKKNTQVINRNTKILPKFVGFNFSIHNGKNYVNLLVKEQMIGRKFGEFSVTRLNSFNGSKS